jgi:hypothetical protein
VVNGGQVHLGVSFRQVKGDGWVVVDSLRKVFCWHTTLAKDATQSMGSRTLNTYRLIPDANPTFEVAEFLEEQLYHQRAWLICPFDLIELTSWV